MEHVCCRKCTRAGRTWGQAATYHAAKARTFARIGLVLACLAMATAVTNLILWLTGAWP